MNIETWNQISFAVFVGAFVAGAVSTSVRIVNLWRAGVRLPVLIWRDALVTGGIALSFLMISWHRAIGAPYINELWWYVTSSVPALVGAISYLYFDLFVIGHGFRDMMKRYVQWLLARPADKP